MQILKMATLLVAGVLLATTALALTDEQASRRWNELQATGLNAEQVIRNLYAAGDLSAEELLHVVLSAPDRQEALTQYFRVSEGQGKLEASVNASADAAYSYTRDLPLQQLLPAADAAGPHVLRMVTAACAERGNIQGLSGAFLSTKLVAEEQLAQYLLEAGADPREVKKALTAGPNPAGGKKTMVPDRVSVSPSTPN